MCPPHVPLHSASSGLVSAAETPLALGSPRAVPGSHSSSHNGLCDCHWTQPLVIRDNAWPIVPKDTPGSLEACDPTQPPGPVPAGRLPRAATWRLLPSSCSPGSRGSGHTFPPTPLQGGVPTLSLHPATGSPLYNRKECWAGVPLTVRAGDTANAFPQQPLGFTHQPDTKSHCCHFENGETEALRD